MSTIEIPTLYPKQEEFCKSTARATLYGGAVGGGKSYVVRVKAHLLALNYPGINILLIRSSLPEVIDNHKIDLQNLIGDFGTYVGNPSYEFRYKNGSLINLGYCSTDDDLRRYQGQQYDAIFIDEAGNFVEKHFRWLVSRNRLSGRVDVKLGLKPRIYLTANPVGVGLRWLKRLFVDKKFSEEELFPYKKKVLKVLRDRGKVEFEDNPKYHGTYEEFYPKVVYEYVKKKAYELCSNDYKFIPSTVYDNEFLMLNDPDYIATLESMPAKQREALLLGSWDSIQGAFFEEFDEDKHVIDSFSIPRDWRIYRARDFGLDMTACLWIALDPEGFSYVFREFGQSGLIVGQSADIINTLTLKDEVIYSDICPPDMWNKNQQTGRSAADILREHSQFPTKANNDRIQGWLQLKELFKESTNSHGEKVPRLRIFRECIQLIESIKIIQTDEKNPNDAAKQPHDVTHFPDALRYYATSYTYPPDIANERIKEPFNMGKFALGEYDEDKNEIESWWNQ